MNANIDTLYEFTLQQMAAESCFEGESPSDTAATERRLLFGTNRPGCQFGPPTLNEGYPGYTRMTSVQADEFLSKHSLVLQWSDNPTPTGSRPALRTVLVGSGSNEAVFACVA